MPIAGVLTTENDHSFCFHIDTFTDELKGLIREHLSTICYGKNLVSRGLEAHSYQNTLASLKGRYEDKTPDIRKGMIGELLTHVVICSNLEQYEIASPYFNMEEKSARKGFDLLLVADQGQTLWVTEVKSGELGATPGPDQKTRNLLQQAKRDLNERLNQAEQSFWQNAINTVLVAISDCTDYKDAVIEILGDEQELAATGEANSQDNSVILVSVLYHDPNNKFDPRTTEAAATSIADEDIFGEILTISIQKEAYQQIADFLFEEELDA